MAIYIKGVEISKHCIDCPFMVSRDNDDCILQSDEVNEKFDSWDDMKASCPLVEIPEPHGRLIDADKLADDLETDGKQFGDDIKLNCASWLRSNSTPTVIEGSAE